MTPISTLFNIQHIQGSSQLAGLMSAYALIQEDSIEKDTPQGVMTVTGDYRNQRSLKEFIEQEFGPEGSKAFKDAMTSFREDHRFDDDLDLDALENKLQTKMEIVPVPARMILLDTVEDVLKREGDIYFLGTFTSINNAQMMLGVFPILYQTAFKEQEVRLFRSEIDDFLSQIEQG
jgi:hypothetical protein